MSVTVELVVDNVITLSPNLIQLVNMGNLQFHINVILNFYISKWFEYRILNSNEFTNILLSSDSLSNYIRLIMIDEEERGCQIKTFPQNIHLSVLTQIVSHIHGFYSEVLESLYLSAMTSINNLLANAKSMWFIKNSYKIKTISHCGSLLIYVTYE